MDQAVAAEVPQYFQGIKEWNDCSAWRLLGDE